MSAEVPSNTSGQSPQPQTSERITNEGGSKPAAEQLQLEKALGNALGKGEFEVVEPHRWVERGTTLAVKREKLFSVCEKLKSHADLAFEMLIDVTCIDWLDDRPERFEMVYHFMSLAKHHRLCLKVFLDEDLPKVASLRSLWPTANFLEREVFDMFGIEFENHGDLRRILMYEEFVGYPLRKDYPLARKQPRVEMRIPEFHNTSKDMRRRDLVSLPSNKAQSKAERAAEGAAHSRTTGKDSAEPAAAHSDKDHRIGATIRSETDTRS